MYEETARKAAANAALVPPIGYLFSISSLANYDEVALAISNLAKENVPALLEQNAALIRELKEARTQGRQESPPEVTDQENELLSQIAQLQLELGQWKDAQKQLLRSRDSFIDISLKLKAENEKLREETEAVRLAESRDVSGVLPRKGLKIGKYEAQHHTVVAAALDRLAETDPVAHDCLLSVYWGMRVAEERARRMGEALQQANINEQP